MAYFGSGGEIEHRGGTEEMLTSDARSIVRELVDSVLQEHNFKLGDRVKAKAQPGAMTSSPGTAYKIDGDAVHVKHDDGEDLRYHHSWIAKHRGK
jgi:hypothetical protein